MNYPIEDRWTFAWLGLGTLMTLISTGRWNIPLITWLGSIFILRFVRSQPMLKGYLLAWLTNFVTVSLAWWIVLGYGSSLLAFLITMALSTPFIGLYHTC